MKKPILIMLFAVLVLTAGFTLMNFDTLSKAAIASAATIFNKNDRADSLVVKIKTDSEVQTYYTFSKIGYVRSDEPSFLLESIPTKDKKPFYQWIDKNKYNQSPQTTNIEIAILAGDGSAISTLIYKDCKVDNYFAYVDDSKGSFSLSGEQNTKPEIRDVVKFTCVGFSISTK